MRRGRGLVGVLGAGLVLAGCAAPTDHAAAPAAPASHERATITTPKAAEPPAPEPVVAAVAVRPAVAVATTAATPEPEPEPIPFEGLAEVPLSALLAELERVAEGLAEVPAVREDYAAFLAAHGLEDSEVLYRDYVRVKLVFESTRDGGLWHMRWDITNESPNSEQIWKQWTRAKVPEGERAMPTAFAECDELSALFAFLVYRMGVRHVGLYWPTWNHVVAVWTVQSAEGKPVRIVVPTSQIFLTEDDSLGTKGFDPWSQRTIYEYRRRDVKGTHALDAELARFFVEQARRYGGRPQVELQRLRNERDGAMGAALAARARK